MTIESVVRKTIIVINGVEHILSETSWTESVHEAQNSGMEFESDEDVIDWVESVWHFLKRWQTVETMKPKIKSNQSITCHRDLTISYFSVYKQIWQRVSAYELTCRHDDFAALSQQDRKKINCKIKLG